DSATEGPVRGAHVLPRRQWTQHPGARGKRSVHRRIGDGRQSCQLERCQPQQPGAPRAGVHRRPHHARLNALTLDHYPEKWERVFGKKSWSIKKVEQDDDSKKSHPVVGAVPVDRPSMAAPRRYTEKRSFLLTGLTPQVGLARLAALNIAELRQARVPMQSINLRKNFSRGRWKRESARA